MTYTLYAVAWQVIGIDMQTYWLNGARQRADAHDDRVLLFDL